MWHYVNQKRSLIDQYSDLGLAPIHESLVDGTRAVDTQNQPSVLYKDSFLCSGDLDLTSSSDLDKSTIADDEPKVKAMNADLEHNQSLVHAFHTVAIFLSAIEEQVHSDVIQRQTLLFPPFLGQL